jgi:hypothetical protein
MHIQPYTSLQSVHSRPVETGEAGASGAERENLTVSGQRAGLIPVVPPQEDDNGQAMVSGGARPSPSYRRWFKLFTVVVGTFMAMLDAFVVNVAIPFPRSTTIMNNPQQAYPHSRSISAVA